MGERRRVPGGPSPGQSGMQQLATYVREVYLFERRAFEEQLAGIPSSYRSSSYWDGGVTATGKRSTIWERVAKFIIDKKLPVDTFIRRQFQYADGPYVIKPNQLYNAAAMDRYLRGRSSDHQEILLAWRSQHSALAVALVACQDMAAMENEELSKTSLQATVLLNEDVALSALFRYCLAKSEGLTEISRLYRDAAALQYMRHRKDYDQIWKNWIPNKFKARAAAVYQQILTNIASDRKGKHHDKEG